MTGRCGFRVGGLAGAVVLVLSCVAAVVPPPASAERPRCATRPADIVVQPPRAGASAGRDGAVIVGSRRDDRITGGRGRDRLCGRRGGDRVGGGRAADVVSGGRGRDHLGGGRGSDRLASGPGGDRLRGQRGADALRVADGFRDAAASGPGPDYVGARDGVADSVGCGRGPDIALVDPNDDVSGCEVANSGTTAGFGLPSWSDGIWHTPDKYLTIQGGDIDGDGAQELLGRGPLGLEAYRFDASLGNWMPLYQGADPLFPDSGNWDQPGYYRTLQTADLDGNGADELLIRGAAGLFTYGYRPASATWSQLGPAPLGDLADSQGWDEPEYYETIQTASIDFLGTSAALLLARGAGGLLTYQYDPSQGTYDRSPAAVAGLADSQGWTEPEYYETIQTGDVTGDGSADLIARTSGGVRWWQYDGSDPARWVLEPDAPGLGADADGWDQPQYYETIQTADLDGDGDEEILGRGPDGLEAYELSLPSGLWSQLPTLGQLSDANGWNQPENYETIHAADLDGNGTDEVLARDAAGLHAFALGAGGWQEIASDPDFSNANGWDQPRYYETIKSLDVTPGQAAGSAMVVGRGATGVQNAVADLAGDGFDDPSLDFPSFAGNAGEQAAYAAINSQIGRGNPSWTDLRTEYGQIGSAAQFAAWANEIEDAEQPPSVPDEAWNAVQQQLRQEVSNGEQIATWFEDTVQGSITETFVLNQGNASAVMDESADTLDADPSADAQSTMLEGLTTILELGAEIAAPEAEEGSALLYLTATALGAGLGPDGVDQASQPSANYAQLSGQVASAFQAAIDGNLVAERAVVGDYGLQLAAQQMIGNGLWSEPSTYNQIEAASQASFTVWTWQQLAPTVWTLYHDGGGVLSSYDYCASATSCYTLGGPPERHVAPPNATVYYTPGENVRTALTNQLFGPIACTTNWNAASCNLGIQKSDFFAGAGGWDVPVWQCGRTTRFGYTCTRP